MGHLLSKQPHLTQLSSPGSSPSSALQPLAEMAEQLPRALSRTDEQCCLTVLSKALHGQWIHWISCLLHYFWMLFLKWRVFHVLLGKENYHNRPGSWAGLHRMKVPSIPFPSYICALSSHSEVQPEVSAEFLPEFQAKKLVKGSRDKIISGRWEHNHKKTLFCHSRLQALLFSLYKLQLYNLLVTFSIFQNQPCSFHLEFKVQTPNKQQMQTKAKKSSACWMAAIFHLESKNQTQNTLLITLESSFISALKAQWCSPTAAITINTQTINYWRISTWNMVNYFV